MKFGQDDLVYHPISSHYTIECEKVVGKVSYDL